MRSWAQTAVTLLPRYAASQFFLPRTPLPPAPAGPKAATGVGWEHRRQHSSREQPEDIHRQERPSDLTVATPATGDVDRYASGVDLLAVSTPVAGSWSRLRKTHHRLSAKIQSAAGLSRLADRARTTITYPNYTEPTAPRKMVTGGQFQGGTPPQAAANRSAAKPTPGPVRQRRSKQRAGSCNADRLR